MRKKRILISANPDLNHIDGSSIWSQTLALVLAATEEADVHFVARTTPDRTELFGPLQGSDSVKILDATEPSFWGGNHHERATLAMMAELAVRLDSEYRYDLLIVRGLDIATGLLQHPTVLSRTWLYLTDIKQDLASYSHDDRVLMHRLAAGSGAIRCQTGGFCDLWKALAPGIAEDRLWLYTPVIPDAVDSTPPLLSRPKRAVYAGKFAPDWKTLEMVELWPQVFDRIPDGELVMIGDKIHSDPSEPDYPNRMRNALEYTRGVNWLGPRSRESVQTELQQARVGLSWRSESLNHTVEYSTKILEYGSNGCAAIVNRNAVHEELLGPDYPLYANSPEEFIEKATLALTNDAALEGSAATLRDVATRHSFSSRVVQMKRWIATAAKSTVQTKRSGPDRKTRVLVVGHDLKFFSSLQARLEETGEFEFLVDKWSGHDKHDEAKSRELLGQADVVVCEWCLGNVVWYSHHVSPDQRLVARFHLQERDLPYLAEANWESLEHIAFVSEYVRQEAQRVFGLPAAKASVIPNYLDPRKFYPKKKTTDAPWTLGMIGSAPSRKRLDRAVDLLSMLLDQDARFVLRVKGRHPLNYPWLIKRHDELRYYRALFERINSSDRLRTRVIFDPPGDDVNDWLSMVGFILSPSDFESFHMSVGEGILAGSRPIVWPWDGAEEIWTRQHVYNGTEDIAEAVLTTGRTDPAKLPKHLRPDGVVDSWVGLLRGNDDG